jgi:hypothetical protein
MTKKQKLIPKVKSLFDLKMKAKEDPRYAQLAKVAARNLGCGPTNWPEQPTLAEAMRWLEVNAEVTSERGVVGEINFVRDCIQ